jgi:hypothetical protein
VGERKREISNGPQSATPLDDSDTQSLYLIPNQHLIAYQDQGTGVNHSTENILE